MEMPVFGPARRRELEWVVVDVDLEYSKKNWLGKGLGPEWADFDVDLAAFGSKALKAASVEIFSVSRGRPGGPFGRGG